MLLYWCWTPQTTNVKWVNKCHNFQWACFTTVCSLHSLASLVCHCVSKPEDSLKESSVGQETQKLHSAILAALFSKFCTLPAKLSLGSARLCILEMIVNLAYQYSTIQRQAKHQTCWQNYSILAPLHCVIGVWKGDWNLSKTNSSIQWVKAELNKRDCRINRLLPLSSSSCTYMFIIMFIIFICKLHTYCKVEVLKCSD